MPNKCSVNKCYICTGGAAGESMQPQKDNVQCTYTHSCQCLSSVKTTRAFGICCIKCLIVSEQNDAAEATVHISRKVFQTLLYIHVHTRTCTHSHYSESMY